MDRFEPAAEEDAPLEITPQGLRQRLTSAPDLLFLDVRQPWEYEIIHLPGAVLIPLHELAARLAELDAARPIIVYCHHGIRSYDATLFLRHMGYPTAQSLQGGIDRWSAEIDPSLPRY